jgi:hypothetical protein
MVRPSWKTLQLILVDNVKFCKIDRFLEKNLLSHRRQLPQPQILYTLSTNSYFSLFLSPTVAKGLFTRTICAAFYAGLRKRI